MIRLLMLKQDRLNFRTHSCKSNRQHIVHNVYHIMTIRLCYSGMYIYTFSSKRHKGPYTHLEDKYKYFRALCKDRQ